MCDDPAAFRISANSPSPTLTESSTEYKSPASSEANGLSTETQRTDFWFDDGSVILLADNVAFKVHRGVLARHSDVFRDMLSIPQPPDEAVFEGCCIVELYDSPADLWYLLKALYDGM